MIDYFFSGNQYVRVSRGETGPGSVNPGYPATIANWNWGSFGAQGIDAALYSGAKCYFFSGNQYIRVTRGETGAGTIDAGYPAPISNWGWGNFGAHGIDAALYSGAKCYFFSGNQYIRVTRGETGAGTIDAGYPAPISNWGWENFGAHGIDAALYSGAKCYFFSGNQYIRVTRGETGAGTIDAGYPAPISNWGWGNFGANGIKGALPSLGAYATAPSPLASNSNYFLTNCANITGLAVEIVVDDAMSSDIGFGFQLNAYSAMKDEDGAQQYVLMFDGTDLWGWVDNWTSVSSELVNYREVVTSFSGKAIPAGTILQIALANDTSGRITAATFTATDRTGHQLGSLTLTLKSLKKDNGQPMTDADLAPITAFQLDVVGPFNGERADLKSGQGTLTYTANSQLGVANTEPSCVDWDFSTEEQANSVYSLMAAASDTQHYQYFISTAAAITAARTATVGHRLTPPSSQR